MQLYLAHNRMFSGAAIISGGEKIAKFCSCLKRTFPLISEFLFYSCIQMH